MTYEEAIAIRLRAVQGENVYQPLNDEAMRVIRDRGLHRVPAKARQTVAYVLEGESRINERLRERQPVSVVTAIPITVYDIYCAETA